MRVVGTAGHVDHGKSTLVHRLTGIDPDRLREEKEREMTIDLGFAWMDLPNGESIGIVDVPGHRDFIDNMLAGVGGIDAALFVIAADEGVMPQTKEHLSILNLLRVKNAVIALTKVDLVNDHDWLDLVEEEVGELLASTVLDDAPIVRVSASSGVGLDDLKNALASQVEKSSPKLDRGRPRLPIDRAFTMAGFGTVVTGTLIDGVVRVGEEVVLLPKGRKGRIRGIQTHKEKKESATPGSRVAINLTGIEVREIDRGDVLCLEGTYQSSRLLDVNFNLLHDAVTTIKHDQKVKLYVGASQTFARVRLLGKEDLKPSETAWLQLELNQPIVVERGDLFILRRPSPGATLGGGMIIDPNPKGFYRRWDEDQLQRLATFLSGNPQDVIDQLLSELGPIKVQALEELAKLDPEDFSFALTELEGRNRIHFLDRRGSVRESIILGSSAKARFLEKANRTLTEYHEQFPLRFGMPKEELKSRLDLGSKELTSLLPILEGITTTSDGKHVALEGHKIQLQKHQEKLVEELMELFDRKPFSPPDTKRILEVGGEEILTYLLQQGIIYPVSEVIVFKHDRYEEMLEKIKIVLQEREKISVADVRDLFQTSRKYALALMEHLDEIGTTKRVGDYRVLRE